MRFDIVKEMPEFLNEMIKAFQRQKKRKRIAPRVIRGRAIPLANAFEDAFGKLLGKVLNERFKILVDYPMSIKPSDFQKTKTIYPDIAICEDDELRCLLELKIDLGYFSDESKVEMKRKINDLRRAKSAAQSDQREKRELLKRIPLLQVALSF